MVENIKSVLVGLTKEFGPEETSSAIGYGLSLAQAAGAHLTVQAASQRIDLQHQDTTWPLSDLAGGANAQLQRLAREAVASVEADAAAAGVVAVTFAPHLSYPAMLASFRALAHVHDLTVIDAEPEPLHPDRDLIEALLVASGRPLLVVPHGWDTFRARRMCVAWDGSGRAARAVHDALPLLRAAEEVRIVAVTGEKALPEAVPGAELAPHLARHGVPVEVQSLVTTDGDVAQTLRDAVTDFGAEMMVMGGYVHSRLRELLFGGVTQSLLRNTPVPLFMSY
ncbi:universal stress protein [Paracoccus benzoatiresistens]|uniref:Universal stress protein n=1 Tax=Paracoccus benzoatiresistens TaxID=2997341 RepID=A0ABT4J8Y9_9RHOB|nr:universal stress protein [Paracoccus sp. EF6]MCZ0963585.1 universal stress protein [Paracoccus sp. EF6]